MPNLYTQLKNLFPEHPLQAGQVIATDTGEATIQLPGGGTLRALGDATIGQMVFVRDGRIEGQAPALIPEIIEI